MLAVEDVSPAAPLPGRDERGTSLRKSNTVLGVEKSEEYDEKKKNTRGETRRKYDTLT